MQKAESTQAQSNRHSARVQDFIAKFPGTLSGHALFSYRRKIMVVEE